MGRSKLADLAALAAMLHVEGDMEPNAGIVPTPPSDPTWQPSTHGGGFRNSNSPKIRRNGPCPCGSGRKYKKCCMDKESTGG